jgi:hypothetical protein
MAPRTAGPSALSLTSTVGPRRRGPSPSDTRSIGHSERAPGAKARPAERVALVPAPRAGREGALVARVWYDDGRVGQAPVHG